MNTTPFPVLADKLLSQQIVLSKQLHDLLKQEYQTLSTNFVESLDAITQDKQPVIIELDALNQHWLKLMTDQVTTVSLEGIKYFLQDFDQLNGTSLYPKWLELQKMARECQKANTINGTIVALRHQSAQQTMAILRGQLPGDTLYDPQGNNSANYPGGNALAKA